MWLVNALLFFNRRGGPARDSEVFHIRFWETQPSWKTGLIKCGGHSGAWHGSSDVSGEQAQAKDLAPGPEAVVRKPRLPATAAHLAKPGALPLPQASPQHLHGRLRWHRGQVRPCLGTLLPVASRKPALSMHLPASSAAKQLRVHRQRGSVFLSVPPSAASPPESRDSIASGIGSHERTCLVVEAIPGRPVSIPECR